MIDWEKAFPIEAGISRRLLKRIGFTEGQIALVTDDDDHGYWEDLELCTNRILQAQEEEADGGEEPMRQNGETGTSL